MSLHSIPQPAEGATAARTYAIDGERSAVRFTVRFLGWRTVRGSFSGLSGRIVECADATRCAGEIRLPVATVRTSNRLRDRHLRSSHYFHAGRFPEIVFRATAVRTDGGRTMVTGTLTVRDVSQVLDVELTHARARITSPDRDGRLRLRGSLRIDRVVFGLRGAGLLGLADGLIGRAVDCEIDLEAARIG